MAGKRKTETPPDAGENTGQENPNMDSNTQDPGAGAPQPEAPAPALEQAPAASADDKRKAIAVRDWINAAGEVVKNEADATGFRYTYRKTGSAVDYQCDPAKKLTVMFACMGGLTKVGNIVNSIVNADDYNGDDPMPDVVSWLAGAENGVWREPTEAGARGPKYNRDVLAGVLHTMIGPDVKGDVVYYREKLNDASYYAKVRGNAGIMNQYHQEMARRGADTAPAASTLA